jgi:hypothetical protein
VEAIQDDLLDVLRGPVQAPLWALDRAAPFESVLGIVLGRRWVGLYGPIFSTALQLRVWSYLDAELQKMLLDHWYGGPCSIRHSFAAGRLAAQARDAASPPALPSSPRPPLQAPEPRRRKG